MRRIVIIRAVLILAALLSSPTLYGHNLAPSLLMLEQRSQQHSQQIFQVTWKTPLKSSAKKPLQPLFPSHCETMAAAKQSIEGSARVLTWPMQCSEHLVGSTLAIDGMRGSGTATLLKIQWLDGGGVQQLLSASQSTFVIPAEQSLWQIAVEYSVLGVEHIWLGIDHLLFVLALVLLVRYGKRLLWTITAFTVGHSITLSLVVLGYIDYPVTFVEFSIAASIFVLAVELSRSRDPIELNKHWMTNNSWLVAVAFGLLHGMGFAGALSEVGLPAGDIPLALLSFNVGIELGQIAFVALCLALMRAGLEWRSAFTRHFRWANIYIIGSLSAFWCIERGLSLFS